ncbi:Cof-type HAD-IIB family hydrolase [Propionibacteriaceae bacterium G1746]|uniref:Cof-type HAD-IIB family hydrolase n=1 Tax=Aestuariimicrobium sp. G57 TaxID=3418485 RepID=UPI003C20FED3
MTSAPSEVVPSWSAIARGPHDVRMVVSDMDGTLLDDDGAVPEGFWPVLDWMQQRGIVFVPASGRQYATLTRLFDHVDDNLSVVAENGSMVVHDGEVVSATVMSRDVVRQVIEAARSAPNADDLFVVVCGLRSAYLDRTAPEFEADSLKYFAKLERVDDLLDVDDDALKIAIYDFGDTERTAATQFAHLADDGHHQVIVSAARWIDVMSSQVDKGQGVRALQRALDITPGQTVIFGDYLNDLQMMAAGQWSFAMQNAHPQIRATAKYLAPRNTEHGVVTVLEHLLGI